MFILPLFFVFYSLFVCFLVVFFFPYYFCPCGAFLFIEVARYNDVFLFKNWLFLRYWPSLRPPYLSASIKRMSLHNIPWLSLGICASHLKTTAYCTWDSSFTVSSMFRWRLITCLSYEPFTFQLYCFVCILPLELKERAMTHHFASRTCAISGSFCIPATLWHNFPTLPLTWTT